MSAGISPWSSYRTRSILYHSQRLISKFSSFLYSFFLLKMIYKKINSLHSLIEVFLFFYLKIDYFIFWFLCKSEFKSYLAETTTATFYDKYQRLSICMAHKLMKIQWNLFLLFLNIAKLLVILNCLSNISYILNFQVQMTTNP